MAHLILVSEGNTDAEITESDVELGSEEQSPLLRADSEASCSGSTGLKEITANYSLIPDASLPAQVRRPSAIVFIALQISNSIFTMQHCLSKWSI